jgi:hypothetical protein
VGKEEAGKGVGRKREWLGGEAFLGGADSMMKVVEVVEEVVCGG